MTNQSNQSGFFLFEFMLVLLLLGLGLGMGSVSIVTCIRCARMISLSGERIAELSQGLVFTSPLLCSYGATKGLLPSKCLRRTGRQTERRTERKTNKQVAEKRGARKLKFTKDNRLVLLERVGNSVVTTVILRGVTKGSFMVDKRGRGITVRFYYGGKWWRWNVVR